MRLVPGATPKNPFSGLTAHSRPSCPIRSHAMSSPTVQTFQPFIAAGGISIARFVLPQAAGNAPAMYRTSPLRVFDAGDEHVLGHPALPAGLVAGDAEAQALLAQQGVAAIPAAHAPDRIVLREVADEPVVHRQVGLAMHAAGEVVAIAQLLPDVLAHPRHDPHGQHHVEAVSQLHGQLAEGAARLAHDKRHDVHRAALVRAVEEAAELPVRLVRGHPVVRRPGLLLRRRADERQVLRAGHIVLGGPVEQAAGQFLLVELLEIARLERLGRQTLLLVFAAVAPVDPVRLDHLGHLVDPGLDVLVRLRTHLHHSFRRVAPAGRMETKRPPWPSPGAAGGPCAEFLRPRDASSKKELNTRIHGAVNPAAAQNAHLAVPPSIASPGPLSA